MAHFELKERFVSKKRTALDGKVWWCVWDKESENWSTFTCHNMYSRKVECDCAIAFWNGYGGAKLFK